MRLAGLRVPTGINSHKATNQKLEELEGGDHDSSPTSIHPVVLCQEIIEVHDHMHEAICDRAEVGNTERTNNRHHPHRCSDGMVINM